MKTIITVALALSLSACGWADRVEAKFTGYSTLCISGVQYLQFTSGASVQYTPDGKVVTCTK